jgi:hypothetical protein
MYFIYFCSMQAAPYKAKQFLVLIIKLLIVGGAFYFIYDRIAGNKQLDWVRFTTMLTSRQSFWLILAILFLTFLNRFLEILKWQNLVSYLQPLSLGRATEQVLAAVTAALFTPNGIGEYAAKAMYYSRKQSKAILMLNLVCNGIQPVYTVVGGLAGLFIFNAVYNAIPAKALLVIFGFVAAVVLLFFSVRKITVKGFSIHKLFEKINEVPKAIHRKNILLASGRYLSMIHQHYLLFLAFGVDLPYPIMISVIACIYFLGSSLPSFQFLDFAVRGSVGVFFFEKLGVNEWVVVFAATLQWFLNIVIPVTIGSYFVFRFKSARNVTAPEEIISHQE